MPGPPDRALLQALPSSSSGPQGPESPSAPDWQQQTILMLKEQNRLLTQVSAGGVWAGTGVQSGAGGRAPAGAGGGAGAAGGGALTTLPPAQEVTDKSERITQLEQEKSALIKQLFEARALSQQDAGPLDSTFM